MTFAKAAKEVSRFDWTLRHLDGEYVVYPKGSNTDHPAAYFSPDLGDAVATARSEYLRSVFANRLQGA